MRPRRRPAAVLPVYESVGYLPYADNLETALYVLFARAFALTAGRSRRGKRRPKNLHDWIKRVMEQVSLIVVESGSCGRAPRKTLSFG